MSTVPASTTTIRCLCRAINEPGSVFGQAKLPLPVELCHCGSCRYSSGALFASFAELQDQPSQASLDQCIEYASSEKLGRYFCRSCGSHVFVRARFDETKPVQWFVWAACIERPDPPSEDDKDVDTIEVTAQIYAKDTQDGGVFKRMVEVAKEDPENKSDLLKTVHSESFDEPPLSADELADLLRKMDEAAAKAPTSEKLHAKCHCGTVQYYLTRPDPNGSYSDLVKYYILSDDNRWKARPCWCRSCCISTGDPFQAWAYAPPEHILTMDGQIVDFVSNGKTSTNLKGIKQYKSSEPVTWSFCGTCGATVFYENRDRPWVIDLAPGLFRSSRGAMAEDFLSWLWTDDGMRKECRNQKFLEGIVGK